MNHPTKIKIIEPFLMLIVVGTTIIYLLNALNSGNWFWFRQTSTIPTPKRIVIVNQGEETVLLPGHANFNAIAEAAATSLSDLNNTDLISIGLSEQTLRDYDTNSIVLKLYFEKPVQFNTLAPTELLIPIEGRHAGSGYVFRGARGEWWSGAIRMADPTLLYQALQEMGITAVYPQPIG